MHDGDVNFKYGYALELVCRELGEHLPSGDGSMMQGEWFDTIDDAFAELGGTAKLSSEVFWSGPPVELPFIDDFPVIGSVSAERVAMLARELEHVLSRSRPDGTAAAMREILAWLRGAERQGAGLVTFYY